MQYNAVQVFQKTFSEHFALFSPYQTASFGRFLLHLFFLRDHTPGLYVSNIQKSVRNYFAVGNPTVQF